MTTRLRAFITVTAGMELSVTETLTANVAETPVGTEAVKGVPLITPVEALMASPAGRPVAAQLYGAIPPVAAAVAV